MGKLIALAILIILSLSVGCPSPEPEMNTQLKVTPSTQVVQPGETFTVDIEIVPGTGIALAGAQLNISFNELAMEVNDVQEGNFLTQGGAPSFFMHGTIGPSSVINIAGVVLGADQSVNTPGVFVTLFCTALVPGHTSNFGLSSVIVADKDGVSLPLESPIIRQATTAVSYDINLDGLVDTADLLLVYQAFGPASVGQREDIKGDSQVNVLDLVLVAQHLT